MPFRNRPRRYKLGTIGYMCEQLVLHYALPSMVELSRRLSHLPSRHKAPRAIRKISNREFYSSFVVYLTYQRPSYRIQVERTLTLHQSTFRLSN